MVGIPVIKGDSDFPAVTELDNGKILMVVNGEWSELLMPDYIASDTELTSIANAIRTKGGTSASLVFPNGFVSAIGDIQTDGGGGNVPSLDVVFYDVLANDCAGGIVYSYTAAEFANLSSMPANPNHSSFSIHDISIPMTSQGWNYSLADAKAYVAKYGKLTIMQMYIPTDGKSHYICYVPLDAPVERWNTEIDISVGGGSVNWQVDDGATSTASGNISVTFPSVGWHDVKISAPSGVVYAPRSSSSQTNILVEKIQKIKQVFLGSSVGDIQDYAFAACYSLTLITIPNGVTSIYNYAFRYCHSLRSIAIPDSMTSIGNYVFYYCTRLAFVAIPDSVTSIGNNVFYCCYGLTFIAIPDSVTNTGGYTFYGCYALSSIVIPHNITNIDGHAFDYCYSLTSVIIPDSVTTIRPCAFTACYSLTSITIPDSVTEIGYDAFQNCWGLKNIIMESSTPPTLTGSSAFSGLLDDYSIIVPAGSLSAYSSASYWSSVASHIVEAS